MKGVKVENIILINQIVDISVCYAVIRLLIKDFDWLPFIFCLILSLSIPMLVILRIKWKEIIYQKHFFTIFIFQSISKAYLATYILGNSFAGFAID
jgi:hypothetical protein